MPNTIRPIELDDDAGHPIEHFWGWSLRAKDSDQATVDFLDGDAGGATLACCVVPAGQSCSFLLPDPIKVESGVVWCKVKAKGKIAKGCIYSV